MRLIGEILKSNISIKTRFHSKALFDKNVVEILSSNNCLSFSSDSSFSLGFICAFKAITSGLITGLRLFKKLTLVS